MEWTPVLVSALIAAVVGLITALIPPLFRKRVDDTEIMAKLQQITNQAVSDKAESDRAKDQLETKLMKEIAALKAELSEQKSPIEVIVRINTHPRPSIISAVANFITRTGA